MTDTHESRQARPACPGAQPAHALARLGVADTAGGAVFAAWLAADEWLWGRTTVTVHFADVEGIKPGAPVRYKRRAGRHVDGIKLDNDMQRRQAVAGHERVMDGHLGEGTRFWIVQPGFAPIRSTSIISGAYRSPSSRAARAGRREFDGLDEAPILKPEAPGRVFVLTSTTARA